MRLFYIVAALTLAGCIRTAPAPGAAAYWVASDASQYSPVARFRTRVDVYPDHLLVTVDSGTLSIPGEPGPAAPPLMSDLYLSAIVAVADSTSLATVGATTGSSRHPVADRRGWEPLATSDSVSIARELRYGERAPMPVARLAIPGSFASESRTLWLIFRIAGNTVALMAPAAAGGPVRRQDLPGGVRVYACGDHDLFGRLEAARARALKQAYGIAC